MSIVHDLRLLEIDGWMEEDELEFLHAMASACTTGIEIGAFKGRSTCALAHALKDKKDARLSVIDTFEGTGTSREAEFKGHPERLFREFMENLGERDLAGVVIPFLGSSGDRVLVNHFEDASVDFLFIDGSHDRESVTRDLALWTPKVKKGGVLCGHDYHETWPSVVEAVDEFFVGAKVENPVGGIWKVTR
jgi:predicted O-methyltransferase YrrM